MDLILESSFYYEILYIQNYYNNNGRKPPEFHQKPFAIFLDKSNVNFIGWFGLNEFRRRLTIMFTSNRIVLINFVKRNNMPPNQNTFDIFL